VRIFSLAFFAGGIFPHNHGRFVCIDSNWYTLCITGIGMFSSEYGDRGQFSEKFYALFSGRYGEAIEAFLSLVFLNCLRLKIINMPKQRVLIPLITYKIG
jgi:hypothetical protein